MAAVPVRCKYRLTTACVIATLAFGAMAFAGQEMRFVPIRTAPLGSPEGTLGSSLDDDCSDGSCDVNFNAALGCWELKLPAGTGGVEVDLDLQAFGWGMAAGSPTLGAIQATVNPAGYSNGNGGDLNPKSWPGSGNGAYQAVNWCDPAICFPNPTDCGDGSPCNTGPFGPCAVGICIHNPNWVMPACADDLAAIATPTLDFAWATAVQSDCNIDDGAVKTMGGLILEVPADAAGTYMIDLDPDPNNTFMTAGNGAPIFGVVFTPACITILCQSDADCDDGIPCTTNTCVEATSTCENNVALDSCLIDGQCIPNGQVDTGNDCRSCSAGLSQTDWTNRIAGARCGDDPIGTDCNHADTCDGEGSCLANLEPNGATCTDDGNDCTRDFCRNGFCVHQAWSSGTPCGDPGNSDCDGADTCNGSGSCDSNQQVDGTACTKDGVECTFDICDIGVCTHPAKPPGVACGDGSNTSCDNADTCDAAGNCLTNVLPDDAPCLNGDFCDGAESCQGGVCQSAEAPCDLETELCDEQEDDCDLLGDFDGDQQITQADFSHWPECATGPAGEPGATGCEIFDFGQNGFVDLQDNARFQNAFDMP